MKEQLHILLVHHDEGEYLLLKQAFNGQARGATTPKYDLDWVSTYEEALRAFAACHHDVYLLNETVGEHSGRDMLRDPIVRGCTAPIIFLSRGENRETEMTAMQLGAADYWDKDQLNWPLIEHSLRYAIDRKIVEEYLKSVLTERSQVLAQLQRQAKELRALQKATISLLNTLEISSLLGQIMDAAQEAIPWAERVGLHLIDDSLSRSKYWNEASSPDLRIQQMKLPENPDHALTAITQGQPLLIQDVEEEPTLLSLLGEDQKPILLRSAILAPLVVGQHFFGVILLGSSVRFAFARNDLQLLQSFATTASAAIQNAILHAETQELATTDPLIGCLNRRALFDLGKREIDRFRRSSHPLAAMMFDIDDFKRVNDEYGHSTGDQVLVALARRCNKAIRNIDILGRLGGDEFAILLPDTDLHTASEVADRIRFAISETPVTTDIGPISVTISVGVIQASEDTRDLGDLLTKADKALYQSKQAGRNRTSTSN